jgi:DNA adenine methylase
MFLQDNLKCGYQRRPSSQARSPFRYPGGKGFLTDLLMQKVMQMPGPSRGYAEPFCGGAGAAINLLLDGDVDKIYLNDLDARVFSAWVALVSETERFVERLSNIDVTVSEWHKQKILVEEHSVGYDFDAGFATFFVNRTSRAGIITGSGPIGGYSQDSNWKIDARFYRKTMINRVNEIANNREKIIVTNRTAESFLKDLKKKSEFENTFVFIDPPYFEAGSRLYLDGMGEGGHTSLSEELKGWSTKNWLMTYDDHPEIRRLYSDFNVTELEVLYSLQRARKVSEILIQAAGA